MKTIHCLKVKNRTNHFNAAIRYILTAVFALIIAVAVAGCSTDNLVSLPDEHTVSDINVNMQSGADNLTGVPDEQRIMQDLAADKDFFNEQEVQISDLSVIKRQTTVEDKIDLVYVEVKAENEFINCTLSYEMTYRLYNDGWLLDEVKQYENGEHSVLPKKGIADDDVEIFITQKFSGTPSLDEDVYYKHECISAENNLEESRCTRIFTVWYECDVGDLALDYKAVFEYDIEQNLWVLEEENEGDIYIRWRLDNTVWTIDDEDYKGNENLMISFTEQTDDSIKITITTENRFIAEDIIYLNDRETEYYFAAPEIYQYDDLRLFISTYGDLLINVNWNTNYDCSRYIF